MNYLLDTHTLIWAITDNDKLSNTVNAALEKTENSIFVSSITFWEISLKFSLGKLDLQGILPEDLPKLSLQTGFKQLALSSDDSATYHRLSLTNHKDPFDRMLIWQAIQGNLIFITRDQNIMQYQAMGLKTFW